MVRSFVVVFDKYKKDQIKEESCRACSMHGFSENCIAQKNRPHGNLAIWERILLR
jgi:hypothetical protein